MAKGSSNLTGRRSSSRNTKPYDANNSFVKKVATKVTDFIPQRSWISKWFNSSQNEEDVLDDNENPEEVESEEGIQKHPPSKRPCIRMDVTHPPGTFSIQPRAKSTTNDVSPLKEPYSIQDETSEDFSKPGMAGPSGISHLISSTPAIQTDIRNVASQRSELNSLVASTNNGTTNGIDDNSESSESTSGCSSLIPQTNRQEAPSNLSYNSPFNSRKRFHDDKLSFTNHARSTRSLFLENASRDSLSSRRPSFNASIMTNTSDRASPFTSPFYSGNITFGGANAAGLYKRGRKLFNSANEIQLKVPKRTSVEVKPPNAAGVDSSGMSQTAKKILEALEHFSSPITDAKKIPLKTMNNSPSTNRKRAREETALSTNTVGLRHLARELTVPTVPDILKLRRRQKLQDTTAAARRIVSARTEPPPPQEYHIRTQADEDKKHHGKIKPKTGTITFEPVAPVNLPNVPLPISSLPSFNFAPAVNSKTVDKTNPEKGETFTFASPIKVTTISKTLKSINNFTFSSPINPEKQSIDKSNESSLPLKATDINSNMNSATCLPPVTQNFIWTGSSTAPRPKEKVKNSESTIPSVSSDLKSGSVMDILGSKSTSIEVEKPNDAKATVNSNNDATNHKESPSKNDNITQVASSKASIDSTATSTWECSECLFKNYTSETQCFACKVAKPSVVKYIKTAESSSTSSNANETKTTVNDTFWSQFKLSTNQWECTSCFVRNKQTDTKCVACSTLKPGTEQELKTNSLNSEKSAGIVGIKPLEKTWECSKCNTKNFENLSMCLSCKTCKSTLVKTNSEKEEDNNLSIITNTSKEETLEKFKPNKDTWECPCCMVRNTASADTCPCCNTAKPGIGAAPKSASPLLSNGFGDKFKKPEGAWSCDACMVQNEAKVTECVACGGVKPGSKKPDNPTNTNSSNLQFNFSMPANSGGFKFGIDKADDQAKTDNTVSANGFKFGDSQQSSQLGQFTFGIPKEEKNDPLKSDTNDSSKSEKGFFFQSNTSKGGNADLKQSSEKTITPTFSFGIPKAENTTLTNDKEPVNTNIPATVSPTFTFGAPTSNVVKSDIREEKKQESLPGDTLAEVQKTTTVTTESPVVTSISTLPSMTQSNSNEAKPTATFSFGVQSSTATIPTNASTAVVPSLPSTTQSSFTFEPKSTTQAAPLPSFGQIPTTTPTSNITNTFTFGENKATNGSSTHKTFGSLPSAPGGSLFSNISNTPSIFTNSETKTAPTFGQTSSEENKQPAFGASTNKSSTFAVPETKVPTFGNTENKPSIFGPSDTKIPVFGSTDNKTPSLFSPTPQAPVATPAPTPFGAPTLFGSSITSTFGSNTAPSFSTQSTPNIFGSTTTKPNETTTPNPNLFTFGSTPAQPVAQPVTGFNFAANTNPVESPQKPVFTFGSNTTTPQSGNLFGNTFNNPTSTNSTAFTFNAPKPETPAFGQPTAPSPIFGAPQHAAQNQASSSFPPAPANTGFNFGSTAPGANPTPSGGFNFGTAPTSVPSTGFNFNPPSTTPTFDPNTPPSFNFTGGNAPTTFSGTPSLTQRKIKKAFRRMR